MAQPWKALKHVGETLIDEIHHLIQDLMLIYQEIENITKSIPKSITIDEIFESNNFLFFKLIP